MKCTSYCAVERYSLPELKLMLEKKYEVKSYQGPLYVKASTGEEIFLFSFGVVIFWNCDSAFQQNLLQEITPFADKAHEFVERDNFNYRYDLDQQTLVNEDGNVRALQAQEPGLEQRTEKGDTEREQQVYGEHRHGL